jgi:flagellar hook assembly protein FlgD
MNINGINGKNTTAPAATEIASAARTNVGADQTTFLKLLIAQMKNQVPLNPQDSSQ